MFADDTNFFVEGNDINNVLSTFGRELPKLELWFKSNKLSLNTKKNNFIVFDPNKFDTSFQSKVMINQKTIDKVSETKFLGIVLHESLKWKSYIHMINVKIAKIRYMRKFTAISTEANIQNNIQHSNHAPSDTWEYNLV